MVSVTVLLNNLAVAQLQANKLNEAIHLLRISLADVKDEFLDTETSSRTTNQCGHPSPYLDLQRNQVSAKHHPLTTVATEDEDCTLRVAPLKRTLHSVPVLSDLLFNEEWLDHSFVQAFDRAFIIDGPGQNKDLVVAVILYNMALIHHSQGIDRGSSTSLSHALVLYKLSLEVIDNIEFLPVETGLLLLALYNNIAHVYSHELFLHETKTALDELRLILASEQVSSFAEEEDFVLFFLNTVVFPDFTLAPAA